MSKRWKFFDSVDRHSRYPLLHWPYRYNFMTDKTDSSFVPIAVILLYYFAFVRAFREAHQIMLDYTKDKPTDKEMR